MSSDDSTSSSSSSSDVEEQPFTPKKIVDCRTRGNQIQYLVQWNGLDQETWESEARIVNEGKAALIIEYTKSKQMAPPKKVKLEWTMDFEIVEGFTNQGEIYYRLRFPETGIVTDVPSKAIAHHKARHLVEFLEKKVHFPVKAVDSDTSSASD